MDGWMGKPLVPPSRGVTADTGQLAVCMYFHPSPSASNLGMLESLIRIHTAANSSRRIRMYVGVVSRSQLDTLLMTPPGFVAIHSNNPIVQSTAEYIRDKPQVAKDYRRGDDDPSNNKTQ